MVCIKKNKRENKLPKLKRLDIIESYKVFSKKIKKDKKFRDGDYMSLSNIYKELSVRQKKLVESPKVVFGKMAPKKEYIDAPIKRKSSKQSIPLETTAIKSETNSKTLKDIRLKLKDINALKLSLQKDSIKKPITIKYEKISASKSEMKEYKSILAKGKKERLFKHKDILKMQYLYSTMSKEQKKTVENYASVIPPPPPPRMVKKGEVRALRLVGLEQDFAEKFTFGATAMLTGWSSMQELRIQFEPGADNIKQPDSLLTFGFEDQWFYSVGLTYEHSDELTLRTGYAYDNSPVTKTYRSARTPDADRQWLSFGASYNLSETSSIVAAYTYVLVDDAKLNRDGTLPEDQSRGSINADYETNAHVLSVAYNVSF